ncbi:MAG: diguanylate cyclase [Gammaproteobacteria bacterium]|nr:diguanylate cyclase [Gammaproteobacteria bacterium]
MSLRLKKRTTSALDNFNLIIDTPILVIEDSKPLAHMLSVMLKKQWGCEVHVAYSYAQAKEYLNKYRYDYLIAICDLTLPDAPNGEIIDLVSKAKVQSIAISGNYDSAYVKTILDKGVIDFIDKGNTNAYKYATELVGRLYKNYQIKIMIVDDSKTSSDILKFMLEKLNFTIICASNGQQALELLNENKDTRIVLTDFAMPEMDGVELTYRIRQNYSKDSLVIIGISGLNDEMLSANFIKNGANDFLIKPFSYSELLCRVNQNLDMLDHLAYINSLANHDFMTKVNNRRYFFTEGNKGYLKAKKLELPSSVFMMDIDHFKKINDTYGHDCGDIVLINFAKILSEYFKDHLVARLGGEEFAVIIHNLPHEQNIELANTFREAIAATAIKCDSENEAISITVSIGGSNVYEENIDMMLKSADKNLYEAKESGRNKVIA